MLISASSSVPNSDMIAAVALTDTQLMMWLDGIELSHAVQKKRFSLPANARVFETIAP